MPSSAKKGRTDEPRGLSGEQLGEFKGLLLQRRDTLSGAVEGLEREALKTGPQSGELSSLPVHIADLGTDTFEQDMSLGRLESESDELQEIRDALERIEEGCFGTCEGCRRSILVERLRAIPYARLCVECKRQEEAA